MIAPSAKTINKMKKKQQQEVVIIPLCFGLCQCSIYLLTRLFFGWWSTSPTPTGRAKRRVWWGIGRRQFDLLYPSVLPFGPDCGFPSTYIALKKNPGSPCHQNLWGADHI